MDGLNAVRLHPQRRWICSRTHTAKLPKLSFLDITSDTHSKMPFHLVVDRSRNLSLEQEWMVSTGSTASTLSALPRISSMTRWSPALRLYPHCLLWGSGATLSTPGASLSQSETGMVCLPGNLAALVLRCGTVPSWEWKTLP